MCRISKRSQVLVRTSGITYERRFPDGSKEVFSQSDGSSSNPRRIFLTSVTDPQGNAVTVGYDSGLRIRSITDAAGQTTTLDYELEADHLKITKVTDPFHRFARFDYTDGQLTQITDPIGIQSRFSYDSGTDFISSMTTPYGTTTFAEGETGGSVRWLEATDPLRGKERVEYNAAVQAIPASESSAPSGVQNAFLNTANTYYWDKKYSPVNGVYDYTQARVIHWLKSTDGSQISGIKHSEKRPLESRVWYTYAGQPDGGTVGTNARATQVARILDDGTTQASQFEYNAFGNRTKSTDQRGRVMSYDYDTNGIDLLSVRQTTGSNNDLLRSTTYNSQHEPLMDTDAAGQTTTYTYNGNGQVLAVENAKHEVTSYAYGDGTNGPLGYLISITSPSFNSSHATTSFTYDDANRVQTTTNSPDQYSVTTLYDDVDRPIQITYPDGSTQQFQYEQDFGNGITNILDRTASKDRLDRWTYRHYNENRQMDSSTDPMGQTTLYDWCTCGSLVGITDPNGNLTTFNRDLQKRVSSKVFMGGTEIDYTYENTTSRLKSMHDPNGQTTNYQYFADDDLQQVSYTNAINFTPSVTYVYDLNYNRVTSMIDGIGTTNYTYWPVLAGTLGAGKLYQMSGPFANSTITYHYDELGRVNSQDINGSTAQVSYDSLGRLDATTNALGSFSRLYEQDVTSRLHSLAYPNGQTATYDYFDNTGDRRLQTIQNLTGSTNLSRHDYTYDPEGQIQSWNKTLGSTETDLSFGYDDAKQLLSVAQPGVEFGYDYDAAGNRLDATFSARHVHGGNGFTANNLNELDSVSRNPGFGPAFGPFPITYDVDGNMAYDGKNQTFEWDAANRLVAINYIDSGNRTEFAYDGLGRRVKISEYGAVTSATIQPDDTDFNTYTSAPFTVPAGNYTLMFEGLNPSGGNNTALLDSVTLNDTLITNGSFENPTVDAGNYQVGPTDTVWKYVGSAGISTNGSASTINNSAAPDGGQMGFIRNNAAIWQTLALPAGTYSLSFQAAQSGSVNDTSQQLLVAVRGTPLSVKTFVWSGNTIAEERDSTGANVTKRFFAEGEQRVGGSDAGLYYYSRDHLGSIREVTDLNDNVVAQMDYDPWGNESVVAGNMNFDFGFTGHYFHQPSGMNLAKYRAYNPTLGRWISRDPLDDAEMSEGPNLYLYVHNDSINVIDPLGLACKWFTKTDGQLTDWQNLVSHSLGHLPIGHSGYGANGNPAVHLVFHNVCSDPVYKKLTEVKASNGWGAYADALNNEAYIDVQSRVAWGTLLNDIAPNLDPIPGSFFLPALKALCCDCNSSN